MSYRIVLGTIGIVLVVAILSSCGTAQNNTATTADATVSGGSGDNTTSNTMDRDYDAISTGSDVTITRGLYVDGYVLKGTDMNLCEAMDNDEARNRLVRLINDNSFSSVSLYVYCGNSEYAYDEHFSDLMDFITNIAAPNGSVTEVLFVVGGPDIDSSVDQLRKVGRYFPSNSNNDSSTSIKFGIVTELEWWHDTCLRAKLNPDDEKLFDQSILESPMGIFSNSCINCEFNDSDNDRSSDIVRTFQPFQSVCKSIMAIRKDSSSDNSLTFVHYISDYSLPDYLIENKDSLKKYFEEDWKDKIESRVRRDLEWLAEIFDRFFVVLYVNNFNDEYLFDSIKSRLDRWIKVAETTNDKGKKFVLWPLLSVELKKENGGMSDYDYLGHKIKREKLGGGNLNDGLEEIERGFVSFMRNVISNGKVGESVWGLFDESKNSLHIQYYSSRHLSCFHDDNYCSCGGTGRLVFEEDFDDETFEDSGLELATDLDSDDYVIGYVDSDGFGYVGNAPNSGKALRMDILLRQTEKDLVLTKKFAEKIHHGRAKVVAARGNSSYYDYTYFFPLGLFEDGVPMCDIEFYHRGLVVQNDYRGVFPVTLDDPADKLRWYTFEIEWYQNGTYDLWVDGNKHVEGAPLGKNYMATDKKYESGIDSLRLRHAYVGADVYVDYIGVWSCDSSVVSAQ